MTSLQTVLLATAFLGQLPDDNAFPAHRVVGNVYYVARKTWRST